MTCTVWYVVTPAGLSGPYYSAQAAHDAARPFNWLVITRREERAS